MAGYNTLQAVSCPSPSFCAAVDNAGNVISSTDPKRGARAWKTVHLGTPASPYAPVVSGAYRFGSNSVSCPSASFCAILDQAGDLLTSTRPTGGASAWTLTKLASGGSVSCPTASLCVAGIGGNILASSAPTAGASAWTVQYSNPANTLGCGKGGGPYPCPGAPIIALTCKSAMLCVALDEAGDVLSSTDPTGGPGAWHSAELSCPGLRCGGAVSCPSVSFCVANLVGFAASIFTSQNPASGAWTPGSPPVSAAPYPANLSPQSCPSAGLCVAINADGDLILSTNPAGSWTTTYIDHRYPTDAFGGFSRYFSEGATGTACPSPSLCVAIDKFGQAIVGTRVQQS
jgi:hypothetical protein